MCIRDSIRTVLFWVHRKKGAESPTEFCCIAAIAWFPVLLHLPKLARTIFYQLSNRWWKQTDMANNWNIPAWLEMEVRSRDIVCVYCGTPFTSANVSRKSVASWEHIINDEKIITRENIALCCCGCNASKGKKQLSIWLKSKYCQERGITKESVAPVIKQAIDNSV